MTKLLQMLLITATILSTSGVLAEPTVLIKLAEGANVSEVNKTKLEIEKLHGVKLKKIKQREKSGSYLYSFETSIPSSLKSKLQKSAFSSSVKVFFNENRATSKPSKLNRNQSSQS